MKRTVTFLWLLLFTLCIWAQGDFHAKIVDAETGEPLPYVSVYVSEGNGTLSNEEGAFSINARPDDTLRLSCIGYEKLLLKAADIGELVKLKPLTRKLREVTVKPIPVDDILKRLAAQLKKEYKSQSWKESQYFNRTLFTSKGGSELIESFIQGCSAINLRYLTVISGIKGHGGVENSEGLGIDQTNVHHMLELGPMIMESSYWRFSVAPLNEFRRFRSYYDISGDELTGSDGQQIYKINLRYNGSIPASQGEKTVLEGILYVDAATGHLLSFDCNIKNLAMRVHGKRAEAEVRVNVEYRHTNGFTEVFRIAANGGSGEMKFHSLLFNVEGTDETEREAQAGSNLIEAIKYAGYDSNLWERYNIIKRTREEEMIAFGHSTEASPDTVQKDAPALIVTFPDEAAPIDSLQGKIIPQEIVYVHTDNTCYFLGDTLYYKAYVVRSDRGTPSDISQILYTELLNQDGYLVERQMLRLTDGQAAGSFCLPDTLYAGFYELRAYTRWQLNWGRTEHPHSKAAEKWFLRPNMAADFFRDYDKLYSRVFPLYNKPKQAGEYNRDMTLRPLRRYHKIKAEKPHAEVTLYPEGGAWVEGVSQRLAFEANSPEGEHLSGRLTVYDSKHKVIGEGRTEHRGRGTIELTALPAESYTAEFRWGDGHIEKVQLPGREKNGAAMGVEQEDGRLNVSIARRGTVPTELTLTARTNGIAHFSQKVKGDSLCIDTDRWPTGVAQLTLHDEKGKVYADRLCFIRHDDLQPGNVKVTGLPEQGGPLEKVTMMLEAPAQTTLSVAIRDKALSDPLYDNGTLLTEMLLASQLKGFVETPGWYFEQDDTEHRRALNLLLMVQGWRRFRWQETPDSFRMEEPFEKYPIIRGDVSRFSALDQEDYFYVLGTDGYRQMLENNLSGKQGQMNRTSGGQSGPILTEPLALGEELQESDLDDDDHEKKREVQPGEARPFLEGLPIIRGMKVPKERDAEDTKISLLENMGRNIILYTSAKADPKNFQSLSPLKDDVMLHTKFSLPVLQENNVVNGDMKTRKGEFSLQAPVTDGYHFMFLSASKEENVFLPDADEYPEYSVRVRPFYPRYVKPYNYYQTRLAPLPEDKAQQAGEGNSQLREVPVGARRGGLRGFDREHPVMVLDAYDAYNQTIDAGLSPAWYAGSLSFTLAAARLLIGDMGVERSYQLERRWNGQPRTSNITPLQQYAYNHLQNLQSITVYTDYAPRLEGDPRYQASDQPTVTVSLEKMPDESVRNSYRDRFYVMPGLSVCEAFYQPDYSKHKMPEDFKDYRRTLYWNPSLRLDENGRATVSFYNNSRRNQFNVSAQGITEKGLILTSEK